MTNDTNITSADDPRVTAYALGELDAHEAAAVEAFLAGDESARREVDEIRAFAGVLGDELAAEAAPVLHDGQRAQLEQALCQPGAALGDNGRDGGSPGAGGPAAARRPAPVLRFGLPLLAAAALVVAVTWKGALSGGADMAPADSAAPAESPVARGDAKDAERLRSMGYLGKNSRSDSAFMQELGYASGEEVEETLPPNAIEQLSALGYVEREIADTGFDAYEAPPLAPQALVVEGGEPVLGGTVALQGEGPGQAGRAFSFDTDADGAALFVEPDAADDAVVFSDEAILGVGYGAGSAAVRRGGGRPALEEPDLDVVEDPVISEDVVSEAPALAPELVAKLESLGYLGADDGATVFHVQAPSTAAATKTGRGQAIARGRGRAGGGQAGGAAAGVVDALAPATVGGRLGVLREVDAEASSADRRRYVEQQDIALRLARRNAPGESYEPIVENEFVVLSPSNPLAALSTFGVDVDPASYANVRRFLHRNELPPPDAVRLEELVNAFDYADPAPEGLDEHPFRAGVAVTEAPWAPEHRLVRIALKGREVERTARPSSNLVFLLDVSGSMSDADKLPLLVSSMKLLLRELDERDTISVVTYASGSQVVLPPTNASERAVIEAALDGLRADGSTHASAGIQLAYETAGAAFLPEGNNRVLLATDGDFNVGITSDSDLLRMIQQKAKSKVFLTVLGFGTGNLKDSKAELLADNGNGQYAYIDNLDEAHRVLVEELTGTLLTIAQDVKLQVEFNPARVGAYRLLGYENRKLAAQDFRDDSKDAGEIGAGHSVVAYYEVIPTGVALPGNVTLKYQQLAEVPAEAELVESPELLTVNLRCKAPGGEVGHEFAVPFTDAGGRFGEAHVDHRFGAAVAMFGMLLRGSEHAGSASMADVIAWAEGARGDDDDGRRAEFVRLARTAQGLLGVR